MNHHAPVNSTQRTQRLKVKNESSLGGKKTAVLQTPKHILPMPGSSKIFKATSFGPIWVPCSGLKRPPLRESKCHFEEAGMHSLDSLAWNQPKIAVWFKWFSFSIGWILGSKTANSQGCISYGLTCLTFCTPRSQPGQPNFPQVKCVSGLKVMLFLFGSLSNPIASMYGIVTYTFRWFLW